MSAEGLISELGLEPLPEEGGWFRRTRTEDIGGERPAMTCIYALFTREQFSALHRLDVAETLFYQGGDPFEVLSLRSCGECETIVIGSSVGLGQQPHSTFESGVWFGGRPVESGEFGYSLISAVVSPGFVWKGFELGKREELIETFPERKDMIRSLTRDQ